MKYKINQNSLIACIVCRSVYIDTSVILVDYWMIKNFIIIRFSRYYDKLVE